TFRYTVSTIIPQMTKVAWETKKDEIERLAPDATRESFLYGLSRASYEREFGGNYDHPGLRSKILAIVLRIVPKVGPLQGIAFKAPTPEAEALFVKSFTAIGERYRRLVVSASRSGLRLTDTNFDTGKAPSPGAYRRADAAYEALVDKLQKRDFETVSPELR